MVAELYAADNVLTPPMKTLLAKMDNVLAADKATDAAPQIDIVWLVLRLTKELVYNFMSAAYMLNIVPAESWTEVAAWTIVVPA